MSSSAVIHSPPSSLSPVHPLGSRARVLLTSVFGPYAQRDEHGSRPDKPMELYHSQVTRTQEAFSLRMFHRSWGLMLIHANINAPCTLLDFPTLDRFVEEITTHHYDIVGISAITPNFVKVRKMCELIRQHLPKATIVVGGHVANVPQIEKRISADHIVKGEGVSWMRRFLGEDPDQPIRHPHIVSGVGGRTMGMRLSEKRGDVAATLIPSVGCPLGCNFCATSAMFGGKGSVVHFYRTGDELFKVMCELEAAMGVRSFFVMDENFLLHRQRTLRLLNLMIEHDKSWALYVFSSANVLRSYSIEQIVGLGISWVWMGLEGENSRYTKLQGTDTIQLIRTLQAHGVRVLGSSIIGLEEHTPDNIDAVIDFAVNHDTEFHQFMLYSASPGTPLYKELQASGALSCDFPEADLHGQFKFNFKHPHIHDGKETEFLLRAFQRDFEVNGPSVVRIARTVLLGWQRYKNHPDLRIRNRFAWEARDLPVTFAAALWAARSWFQDQPILAARISRVLKDIYEEFGAKARLAAPLAGRYVRFMLDREDRRLRRGHAYEPPCFYDLNEAALASKQA
ncbi:MAG: cobalamin-dependent protein [Verrucomicrobiia bacterium]